ncbi:MAG: hypothetical protein GXO61_05855 [Epsilonproteobacteria bacterium]|nr:hypothetical protein [Campylobacterota bacterium]
MHYPSFFDEVESILLYDPLAEFLGSVEKGIMEFNYLDIVKFAGHSCPTVAGAYLMGKVGLEMLFKEELPVRGEIKVEIKGKKEEGVNGVIGNGIAYICGVSDSAGFKGIGGNFNRSNKLFYDAKIEGEVRLSYQDKKVDLIYDPSPIPPNPQLKQLLQKQLQGIATPQEIGRFRELWQERVKKILFSKEEVVKAF